MRSIRELYWQDFRDWRGFGRTTLNLLVSAALALIVENVIVILLFSQYFSASYWFNGWDALQASVEASNLALRQIRVERPILESWTKTADLSPPDHLLFASDKELIPVVQLCVFSSWQTRDVVRCTQRHSSDFPWNSYLGYAIELHLMRCVGEEGHEKQCNLVDRPVIEVREPRFFYTVRGLVFRDVQIQASLETLSRDSERVAFNKKDTPNVALELCAGTRDVPDETGCGLVGAAHDELEFQLNEKLNSTRVKAMFVGLFQWLTFCAFFYSLIEWWGLRYMWVVPGPTLYADGDKIPRGSVQRLSKEMLDAFLQRRRRSVEDRMFYQVVTVARRIGQSLERDKGGEDGRERLVEAVTSFREHLVDDAVSRQESLEMLGDTMLKLAFMGTVYGISAALFGARGLDTADPIGKLLAKAEMYSGIGIGFGTTIVGIALSIVAAGLRISLAQAWANKIGRAYELIRNFGLTHIIEEAVRIPDAPEPYKDVRPGNKAAVSWKALVYVASCSLIVVVICVWAASSKWN